VLRLALGGRVRIYGWELGVTVTVTQESEYMHSYSALSLRTANALDALVSLEQVSSFLCILVFGFWCFFCLCNRDVLCAAYGRNK